LHAAKRILDLQEALIRAREELRIQATHDPLTGLWNHAEILGRLRVELDRAQRQGTSLGLVMADIDHFKLINDTHGHPAGDAVLCEVARRMLAAVRPYDSIGRYGGEEFMIVVPGCDAEGVRLQAERLRAAIRSETIGLAGGGVSTTVSLGAAATSSPRASEWESLRRSADAALYQAKRNGRDRVEVSLDFSPDSAEAIAVQPPPPS